MKAWLKTALRCAVLYGFCLHGLPANAAASNHAASASGCDIDLSFKPAPQADAILYSRPEQSAIVRLVAKNIGTAPCPKKYLKLIRYQGRQGWVEGSKQAIRALQPGARVELRWSLSPLREGFYTFRPQFIGGLLDADQSNHQPEKKFQAVFQPQ